MHWVMWIIWGSVAALILGSYLVDVLTRRKYSLNKQENTLHQSSAEADALREVGRYNNQSGTL
ncbi:hypothetical protein [Psychrobacillus sp. NPDC096623]|uniref:hypothetical protein n=1 Tax=Psychrobacillus sp. NPDC096623 TaxID=3364492 RepID=UPI00381B84EA